MRSWLMGSLAVLMPVYAVAINDAAAVHGIWALEQCSPSSRLIEIKPQGTTTTYREYAGGRMMGEGAVALSVGGGVIELVGQSPKGPLNVLFEPLGDDGLRVLDRLAPGFGRDDISDRVMIRCQGLRPPAGV